MIKYPLALLATVAFLGASEAHWDYDKHGPAHWGEFSETCSKGKEQSPIDIQNVQTKPLPEKYVLKLDEDRHTIAQVVDNGHSIKITPDKGGDLYIDGEKFQLLQFHYHGLSENTVDGKHFDLEMHMVHQNKDGKLAVIGVFYTEGKNNPALDNILGNVGEKIRIDPVDILPADIQHYYHWKGSLTTPPCSENVEWFLMRTPVEASKDQIAALRKYYNHNYRPTQPLNGRAVEGN